MHCINEATTFAEQNAVTDAEKSKANLNRVERPNYRGYSSMQLLIIKNTQVIHRWLKYEIQ